MTNKKLIIFDFADTLAYLSPSKEELLQQFIHNKTTQMVSIEKITEVYFYINNILFYSSVNIKDNNNRKKFFQEYNKKLFHLLGLSHELNAEDYYEYIKNSQQHWELKKDVQRLLSSLKSKGYLLSLVSNFDTRLYTILNDMHIDTYFDSIFISQEVKLEKPDINFFQLSLTYHHLQAKDAFFIGDSYILDFLPSKELGIHPILLDEHQQYKHLSKYNSISNLKECEKLIS